MLRRLLLLLAIPAGIPACSREAAPRQRSCSSTRSTAARCRGPASRGPGDARIDQAGGPFPYRKDGSVFQNREKLLPRMPRGYYREYTVATPGARDRGARRIVAGGEPAEVFYHTRDHYRSFEATRHDRTP